MRIKKPYIDIYFCEAKVDKIPIYKKPLNNKYCNCKRFKRKILDVLEHSLDVYFIKCFYSSSQNYRMIKLVIPFNDGIDEIMLLKWEIWTGIDPQYYWMSLVEADKLLESYGIQDW